MVGPAAAGELADRGDRIDERSVDACVAPEAVASASRSASRSMAMIDVTPAAASAWTTSDPIIPEPTTTHVASGTSGVRATAWTATDTASMRAACSIGMAAGR